MNNLCFCVCCCLTSSAPSPSTPTASERVTVVLQDPADNEEKKQRTKRSHKYHLEAVKRALCIGHLFFVVKFGFVFVLLNVARTFPFFTNGLRTGNRGASGSGRRREKKRKTNALSETFSHATAAAVHQRLLTHLCFSFVVKLTIPVHTTASERVTVVL